jgi:hypothetical protein
MLKVTVSESAIREMLRNLIEGKDETSPVNVNDVVDPSAGETQPDNTSFTPQNRKELRSALHQVIDIVPDEDASDVYAAIKSAVEDSVENKKESSVDDKNLARKAESMSRTTPTLHEKFVENKIRMQVRKIIREAGYDNLGFSGYMHGSDKYGDEFGDDDRPRKKITSMADVGGDVLQKIADEFGRSVAGAKRITNVSENTARFIASLITNYGSFTFHYCFSRRW